MSRYIEGFDTMQYNFFPVSFDEMIDEDSPVRGICAIVDNMAVDKLQFVHTQTKRTGRPPYNPICMFKIYLYCYYNKIRSSRCIEKECKRNIELMWLTGGLTPDHKTIAEFRKNNKCAIEAAHTEFIRICTDLHLVGKELVAIDGTKIKANNSRKNNVTISKLNKMIEHHDENIHEYLKQLSQNDIAESTDTIKSKLKKSRAKKLECEKLKSEMEADNVREKSLIDPDSHQMSASNKGTDISYNVQNAVDAKEHLIVATNVVTTPADQTQLYSMAKRTADELDIKDDETLTVLADKGYWRAEDLQQCLDDERLNAIVAVPNEQGTPGYRKSDFVYDETENVYICPQGHQLKCGKGKVPTYTNSKACKDCPVRDKCTKSKKGRQIIRHKHEDALQKSIEKYTNNAELYRLRQQIAEHPFGTIKRTLGFTYFLTRRLPNVKTENYLHVITYNLKRVLNIFAVPKLVALLNKLTLEKDKEMEQHTINFCSIDRIITCITSNFKRTLSCFDTV
ncbi:MAG: IS1182 family transposase [Clostridia bacterium]|nr:IS1182 family transposase [Clostridia bacterium]